MSEQFPRNKSITDKGAHQFPIMFSGITLQPNGAIDLSRMPVSIRNERFVFDHVITDSEAMLNYAWALSQVGATVLRLDQSATGIAHLLQSASEPPERYSTRQVQAIAPVGQSLEEIYDISSLEGKLLQQTSAIFGSGRMKNPRMQRVDHRETRARPVAMDAGVLDIMETLHGPLMAAGGSLLQQLGTQEFTYLPGPLTDEVKNKINKGDYRVVEGKRLLVSGQEFPLLSLGKRLQAQITGVGKDGELLDADLLKQEELEGIHREGVAYRLQIAPTSKEEGRPIGIAFSPQGKPLPEDLLLDIVRLEIIRKIGFNDRSSEMNAALYRGTQRFDRDDDNTVNRSNAYDGMWRIMSDLTDYGFEPIGVTLPGEDEKISAFERLYQQTHAKSGYADAISYLSLAAEATHPLVMIQGAPAPVWEYGDRLPELKGNEGKPLRYNLPIEHEMNALMATADFLGWHQADTVKSLEECDADNHHAVYAGRLPDPQLTDAKKTAGILSAALISAEQVIVGHLLANTIDDVNSLEALALKDILRNIDPPVETDKVFNNLIEAAKTVPEGKLGRQYPESQKVLEMVRDSFKLRFLEEFVANDLSGLSTLEMNSFEKLDSSIKDGLVNLAHIATVFQTTPGISTAHTRSHGLQAVTQPVISQLAPELAIRAEQIMITPELEQAQKAFLEEMCHPVEHMRDSIADRSHTSQVHMSALEAARNVMRR